MLVTATPHTDRSIRVLRWVYARDSQRITCELSLDGSALLYELRVRSEEPSTSTRIERFVHAAPAFTRQCEMETEWVENGWMLEHYSSEISDQRA
jgi:hypothetical protein